MASTAKEFAAKIRSKYPGAYDDFDDEDLTRKILAKYPEYSDMVDTASTDVKITPGKTTGGMGTGPFNQAPSKPAVPFTSFAAMAPVPEAPTMSSPFKVPARGAEYIRNKAGYSESTAVGDMGPGAMEGVESQEDIGKIDYGGRLERAAAGATERREAKEKAITAGEMVGKRTKYIPGTTTPSTTPEALAEEDVGRDRPEYFPGQSVVADAYKANTRPFQILAGALEGKSPTQKLGERYLATQEILQTATELDLLKSKKEKGETLTAEEETKLASAPGFWETAGTAVRYIIENPKEFGKVMLLDLAENAPLYFGSAQGFRGGLKLVEKAITAKRFAYGAKKLARFEDKAMDAASMLEDAEQVRKAAQIKRHMERVKTLYERNQAPGVKAAEEALVGPSKAKQLGRLAVEEGGGNVAAGVVVEQQRGNEYSAGAALRDLTIGGVMALPSVVKLKAGGVLTKQEFSEIARVTNRADIHEHPAIQEILPIIKDLAKNPEYKGEYALITKERKTISREAAAKNYGQDYIDKEFPDTPEFEAAGQASGDGLKPGQSKLYGRAKASDAVEEAAHVAEAAIPDGPLKDALAEWKAETRAKAKEAGIDLPNDNELFVQAFSAKAVPESDYPDGIRNLEIPQDIYDEFNRGLGIGGVKEPNVRFAQEKITEPTEMKNVEQFPQEAKITPEIPQTAQEFSFTKAAMDQDLAERVRDYGVDPTHPRALKEAREAVMDDRGIGLLNNKTFVRDRGDPDKGIPSPIGTGHVAYDLGNFKEFNDKYGHVEGGDKVLKIFGDILGKLTEARGGRSYAPHGDEFNGIHPDESAALQIAKEAKEIAAQTKIEFFKDGNKVGEVDGFIVDYSHGPDFKQADNALRAAKDEAKKSRPVYRERSTERRGPGDVLRSDERAGGEPDGVPPAGYERTAGAVEQTGRDEPEAATGVIAEKPKNWRPPFSKFQAALAYLHEKGKNPTADEVATFVFNLGNNPIPKAPKRKSPGSIADRAFVGQKLETTKMLLEIGDESLETVQVKAQDLPDKFKIAGVELTKVKVRDPSTIRYKDAEGHKFDFEKDQVVHTGGEVKTLEPAGVPLGSLPGDEEIPFSLKPKKKEEVSPLIKGRVQRLIDSKASIEDFMKDKVLRVEMDRQLNVAPTHKIPGYGTPEFQSERVFNFDGEEVKGYEAAIERLVEKAKSYAEGDVKTARHATIVLGPPAAGKSRFSEDIARKSGAAIVDPDDVKKVIQEYETGGASSVHEESTDISYGIKGSVLNKLISEGSDIVIPRIGKTTNNMIDLAKVLKSKGYTIDVVSVKVEKNEAFRRMMRRYSKTGRLVKKETYDGLDKIDETVYALNREGLINEPREIDNNGKAETEPGQIVAGGDRFGSGRYSARGSPPAQLPGSVRQRQEVSPERQADLFGGRGRVSSQGTIKGKGVDKGLEGLPLQGAADQAEVDKVQTSLFSLKPASEAGVPDKGGKNTKEIARARTAWEKQGTDSPYFKRWFSGASEKVKDEAGKPIVLFHGTGNKSGIMNEGFSHKFTDKGNDQFGSGFYFTNKKQTAEGYSRSRIESDVPKLGGEESPGIIDAYLAIRNPIITNENNPRPNVNISLKQAKKLIESAPEIKDPDGPLSNWGDVREDGYAKVLNDAVENYTGDQIFALANDFYAGRADKFLENLKFVTGPFIGKKHGLDGWVHEFPTGEKHYVAWFPEQIKSATGNRGTFDPESPNINYSLKTPMVERKVEALRKSESGYGQAYSNLLREKEETWASLEDDARKIAENWDWEDFTKTTKGRQLNASEVMAIGARIADADLREVDALTDAAAARAAGDKKGADIADAQAAAVQLEKVALLQAGLNNATQSARALNVHRKWMDAIAKNADSVFLLKAIRELGVKDAEALKLLRIFKDDPKNFGAAIHSYLKFGAVDKIMEYWKAGLLSGAPTHVANTVGNAVESGLMNAESFVAGGMDKILGLFQNNGERQRYMGEGLRETVGLAKGFIPAAKKFYDGLAPIAKLESKNVNLENKFERQVGAIKGKKGELIRTPFKFLELEDDYFKTLGKYADIQKLAYRKARKEGLSGAKLKAREGEIIAEFWNSPDKHQDIAQEVAKSGKVRTYQEASTDKAYKNSFASLADEIAKAKNSQAQAIRLVSNIIFPFSKTPANIFDRAIERSPLGVFHSAKILNDWKNAAKVYETKAKIAEQNPGNIGHQQAAKSARAEMNRLRGAAADQMARATVGTVALTGVGLLASQGIITGSGPSDPAKRKLMENELGWAPYAVKIGDKYLPLQRIIGAMGPSIGTIADIFEAAQAGDEKGASKSIEASLKNITDQSYLQGLMEFASAVQDPKRYAKTYAMNLGTSMVPFSSLTRSVARAADKTQRDVKGGGFIEEFSNRLQANIPFLSRNLPEKYGATGNVQERKGTTAERLLSPAAISTENTEKIVEKALLNLEYKVPPLERTLKTNLTPEEAKQDYRLEPEEFDVLLKARREATEELRKEIEGGGWEKMDADEQSQTAEDIYRSILNGAREEVKDMIRTRLGKP